MAHHTIIRHAEVRDVAAIAALLHPFAEKNIVLQRNQDDLFEHIQEFVIAEYDGVCMGTAALHVYASHIAEVRSLVVHPDYQGKHIGQMLVHACETTAAQLGVRTVFALTYVDRFFTRMDYQIVPKESLPHKVWTVCIHCEKFSACDEIAVVKQLSEVVCHTPPLLEQTTP